MAQARIHLHIPIAYGPIRATTIPATATSTADNVVIIGAPIVTIIAVAATNATSSITFRRAATPVVASGARAEDGARVHGKGSGGSLS